MQHHKQHHRNQSAVLTDSFQITGTTTDNITEDSLTFASFMKLCYTRQCFVQRKVDFFATIARKLVARNIICPQVL